MIQVSGNKMTKNMIQVSGNKMTICMEI